MAQGRHGYRVNEGGVADMAHAVCVDRPVSGFGDASTRITVKPSHHLKLLPSAVTRLRWFCLSGAVGAAPARNRQGLLALQKRLRDFDTSPHPLRPQHSSVRLVSSSVGGRAIVLGRLLGPSEKFRDRGRQRPR